MIGIHLVWQDHWQCPRPVIYYFPGICKLFVAKISGSVCEKSPESWERMGTTSTHADGDTDEKMKISVSLQALLNHSKCEYQISAYKVFPNFIIFLYLTGVKKKKKISYGFAGYANFKIKGKVYFKCLIICIHKFAGL